MTSPDFRKMTLSWALQETRQHVIDRRAMGGQVEHGICGIIRHVVLQHSGLDPHRPDARTPWFLAVDLHQVQMVTDFLDLAESWPGHSGHRSFPVPSGSVHPAMAFFQSQGDLELWSTSTEYGQARWALLDWCQTQMQPHHRLRRWIRQQCQRFTK